MKLRVSIRFRCGLNTGRRPNIPSSLCVARALHFCYSRTAGAKASESGTEFPRRLIAVADFVNGPIHRESPFSSVSDQIGFFRYFLLLPSTNSRVIEMLRSS